MTQTKLSHITDLHALDDQAVEQFARELAGIVAALRMAARSAKEQGFSLADLLPSITFDTELKDEVIVRDGDSEMRVSTADLVRGDRLEGQGESIATETIRKARRP